MYEQMKKRAKPAYKECRSSKIVKKVRRGDVVLLNDSMTHISRRSKREHIIDFNNPLFGDSNNNSEKPKTKILKKETL